MSWLLVSFVARRDLARACSKLAIALLCLSLVVPPVLVAEPPAEQVRITARIANVRSTPSAGSPILFQVTQGETLRLVERAGDWYLIEAPGGKRGYVYRTLAEVIEPPPPAPAAAPAPPPTPAMPPAPPSGIAIEHSEVSCVIAEHYPRLNVCVTPDTSVGRAQIHFRALDTEPWYAVDLKPEGACLSALLPKPQKATKEIQYYVDVLDRAFTETQKPASAPQGAYRARVIKEESDCDEPGKIAAFVGKVTNAIIVAVVKDPTGRALDAAALTLLGGKLVLAGFSPAGVIAAGTGAATAGGGAAGGGAAAGGAASGGGHGVLLGVIGGVAAVGVGVAVASGGGGSESSTSSGSSGVPTTMSGPQPGTGDLAFRLTWLTTADLDLYVQEPNGNVLSFLGRSSSTGGMLDVDSNAACGSASPSPVENVFWPTGRAPRGNYVFWAKHYGCGPVSSFTLQVLRGVGGSVVQSAGGTLNPNQESTRYSYSY